MKQVTNLMINEFKLRQLKYDFAGYTFVKDTDLSFHHMIVMHRDCKRKRIESDGYVRWNGAILNQKTSHDYIHLIEKVDYTLFREITEELIDLNKKGFLDIENLKMIREMMLYFESKHKYKTSKSGKILIKDDYITKRIKL